MLDLLESAKANLGQLDVRMTNEQNLQSTLKEFFNDASNFDSEFNSNKERAVLKLFDKYQEKVFTLLDLDWNTSLAVKDGEWIFFRASPLKETTKYVCENCDKEYKDPRVYQEHLKSAHQITQTIPKPRVTCRLPHKDGAVHTIQWDQMSNHLLRVHKIPKPSKMHFFRGFVSHDNGKNCSVVWKQSNEDDPTPPSVKNTLESHAGPSHAGPSHTSQADAAEAGPSHSNVLEVMDAKSNVSEDLSEKVNPLCAKNLFSEEAANKKENKMIQDDSESKEIETNREVEPEKSKRGENEEKMSDVSKEGADTQLDISDQFCSDVEYEKIEMENFEEDSDVEQDDTSLFTQMRLRNKRLRYKKREEYSSEDLDPSSLPENQAFIKDFSTFVCKKGISDNPDANTFRKSDGLLFRHDDSWLKNQLKKRPGFKLEHLLNFKNKSEFVELKDPAEWIEEIGGPSGNENPSRQKEMYKSHKQLRDYVSMKLAKEEFGSDFKDLWWKDKVRNNLDQITKDVNNRQVWTKLETLIKCEAREKQISRETLDPNKNANEVKANAVYFSSTQFLEREKKNNSVWNDAMDSNQITEKDFNDFLNFSRHVLAFTDRCRQGVYAFTNQDYFNKRQCWFPEDFTEKDFENIPESHPIFQKPMPERPHDSWLIRLTGSGDQIKLKSGTNVTVNQRAEDLMLKCRDLKDIVFGKLGKTN